MSQAYPRYKPTRSDLIPEVPSNWSVVPLKRVCRVFPSNVDKHTLDDEVPVRLCNYTDVYYNEVIDPEMDLMKASATAQEIEKFTVRAGDVVFTKDSETADDIGIAAYVPQDITGTLYGYHLSIARPFDGVCGRFIKRLFDSKPAKAYFATKANGLTRVGLGQYAIDNLPVPLPPLPEQRAIAAFLDRETGKIDALVEEQRRLIALLKEKRQAVISHAVTKGLDPTAPMKDSGLEGIDAIPAHWELGPLKRYGSFEAGAGFPIEEQGLEDEELPFFKVNAIGKAQSDDRLIPETDRISRETAERLRAFIFPQGSIVFAKIGAALLLGRIRILPCEACIDNNMMGFIVDQSGCVDYFRHLLALVRFDLIANPGTVPSLNERQIAGVVFPIPPSGEQAAIAAFIEEQTGGLDDLISAAEKAIVLLQERRSALISAAVTGKIDVRNEIPDTTEAA